MGGCRPDRSKGVSGVWTAPETKDSLPETIFFIENLPDGLFQVREEASEKVLAFLGERLEKTVQHCNMLGDRFVDHFQALWSKFGVDYSSITGISDTSQEAFGFKAVHAKGHTPCADHRRSRQTARRLAVGNSGSPQVSQDIERGVTQAPGFMDSRLSLPLEGKNPRNPAEDSHCRWVQVGSLTAPLRNYLGYDVRLGRMRTLCGRFPTGPLGQVPVARFGGSGAGSKPARLHRFKILNIQANM